MDQNKLTYEQCISIINRLYSNPKSGFLQYAPNEREIFKKNLVDLTYGEILPNSIKILIEKLDLDEHDVFYDLGSGVGKVPLQFLLTTPIRKSYGIEAYTPRHNIAKQVYKLLHQELLTKFGLNLSEWHLSSIEKNFLEYDFSDATVIFTASLCFPPELMTNLIEKLNNLTKIKYVINNQEIISDKLKLQELLMLENSWTNGKPTTPTYLYTKNF